MLNWFFAQYCRWMYKFSDILLFFNFVKNWIRGRIADKNELEKVYENLKGKNAWQMQEWMRANYQYEADGFFDFRKHSRVFLYEGKGDCEDFANIFEILLPRLGYTNVYMDLVFYIHDDGKRAGHAICYAEKDGNSYGFGNWPLVHYPSADLEEIGDIISDAMRAKFTHALRFKRKVFVESVRA